MSEELPLILLRFSSTFEYELLVRLCLKQWNHPNADDEIYCNSVVESVTEVLREAIDGRQHFEQLPAANMNLVAALWYVESNAQIDSYGLTETEFNLRQSWLRDIRRALPSCFCNPSELL